MEGADYFNRACIPEFAIAGMAVYTGVSTVVTGVFPVLTGSTADVGFEGSWKMAGGGKAELGTNGGYGFVRIAKEAFGFLRFFLCARWAHVL